MASMDCRPFEIRYMERHFEHTQAFIPLNGKPFIAFLAPPSDAELPDINLIQAFLFDGSEGFCMHRGTWHEFPFALENDTQMVVLLSSQTGYDLGQRNPETEEAQGPDLDKKDLARRTGLTFRIDENVIKEKLTEQVQ
jgi:ureidoglycolate lyase